MKIQQFRIGYTDVILNDFEIGKGKIIISDDDFGYNFAYYWGAMGESHTLSTFIQKLNPGYFVGKLSPHTKGSLDLKATMKEVRKWWKHESGIKWYEYQDAQKELRSAFNEIQQYSECDRDFVRRMSDISSEVDCVLFDKTNKYRWFKDALKDLECEPWNFIQYSEHEENEWLRLFLPKLQKYLAEGVRFELTHVLPCTT